jgi:hypothetical protein
MALEDAAEVLMFYIAKREIIEERILAPAACCGLVWMCCKFQGCWLVT